jgi:hypothetical protein
MGVGFWIQASNFRVQGAGCRGGPTPRHGSAHGADGSARVRGPGVMVVVEVVHEPVAVQVAPRVVLSASCHLRLRAQGAGFRIYGLGFRVRGCALVV